MHAINEHLRVIAAVSIPAIVFVLISGCEVGPNYKQPQMKSPAKFGEVGQPGTQPSQITSDPMKMAQWWSVFNDAELNSLVKRAFGSNLDLQQAESRIRQARYQLGIARAPLFPNINASTGYQHARGSKNISLGGLTSGGGSTGGGSSGVKSPAAVSNQSAASPGDSTDTGGANSPPLGGPQSPLGLGGLPGVDTDLFQIGLDASWELDLFGGTQRNAEAAAADLQAATEDRSAMMISVVCEIARTYVQLRGYQWQAAIARDNVATQQETLSIIQDKRRAGLATDLDVSRQLSQLATTQAQLPALESQIRQSIHALGILLGDDPMALEAEFSTDAPLPPTPPQVPIGLPSELLLRRPDIRRAERQLAAASARIGAATADLYPRFSLTGQAGLDSSQLKDLLRWNSRYFLISPGITWPIFDAGRIDNNISIRDEIMQQARLSYQQAVLQAMKEVEDAIAGYRQEQLRRKFLADAVNASQDAVSLARDQYQRGVTDFLTVLDAQRSLFESQNTLAQSDIAITGDLVALYKALGGGWENNASANTP